MISKNKPLLSKFSKKKKRKEKEEKKKFQINIYFQDQKDWNFLWSNFAGFGYFR